MNPILLSAIPIVIYGNVAGLWSPNGSVTNLPTLPPQSRALEVSPVFIPLTVMEPQTEIPEIDACPTYLSAPHLCQNL